MWLTSGRLPNHLSWLGQATGDGSEARTAVPCFQWESVECVLTNWKTWSGAMKRCWKLILGGICQMLGHLCVTHSTKAQGKNDKADIIPSLLGVVGETDACVQYKKTQKISNYVKYCEEKGGLLTANGWSVELDSSSAIFIASLCCGSIILSSARGRPKAKKSFFMTGNLLCHLGESSSCLDVAYFWGSFLWKCLIEVQF